MTHVLILLDIWENRMCFFELWVSPLLTQNADIWNFQGSLTLNNGKLIRIYEFEKGCVQLIGSCVLAFKTSFLESLNLLIRKFLVPTPSRNGGGEGGGGQNGL